MSSLHNVAVLVAVVALLGSIGIGAISQQQASAQGIVVYTKQFQELTSDMEKAVLDAAAATPPEPDRIQMLLDNYSKNVMALFELEPSDTEGDPPSEADPPSETTPPEPDVDPPDPDTEPPSPDNR